MTVSAIRVDGTSGNDTITLTAAVTVPATILANSGADTVTGGGGNDYVSDEALELTGGGGGCGNSSDVRDRGRDRLNGGPGRDTCLGRGDVKRRC